MLQTIPTKSGTEQQVITLEQALHQDNVTINLTTPEDLAAMKADHEARYKGRVKIPNGMPSLAIPGHIESAPYIEFDEMNVEVTTFYMAQAIRDQLADADPLLPLTMEVLLETTDGYIVAGARRGFVQQNHLSVIPVGYADADKDLFEQAEVETDEELLDGNALDNLGLHGFQDLAIIGYQTDPDFTRGINFVLHGKLRVSREQVLDSFSKAANFYHAAHEIEYEMAFNELANTAKAARKARKAGKQAVEAQGFTNINVGDHNPLAFLPKDISYLREIARAPHGYLQHNSFTQNNKGGERLPLMGICRGGLEILANRMEND